MQLRCNLEIVWIEGKGGFIPVRDSGDNDEKIGTPSLQFSKLFNAYAQAINKRYGFRGPLFERPFKRIFIDSIDYLKQALVYIHNNPVHHGFCKYPDEYKWSSYSTCISSRPTKLLRKEVIDLFTNIDNFKSIHDINLSDDNLNQKFEG